MTRTRGRLLARPEETVSAPFLERLTSDVLVYVQPDGGWCLSNAGLVVADGRAVLIDTAATRSRAGPRSWSTPTITGITCSATSCSLRPRRSWRTTCAAPG